MALGNLGLFMERPELEEHDVVTYAFGDMGALYLRGQWTIHRNDPEVTCLTRVTYAPRVTSVTRVRM